MAGLLNSVQRIRKHTLLNRKQMEQGQLPPQDIELERAVLGAIIIEPEAYLKVSDLLNPTDFYKAEHVIIFDCIVQMFANNVKIDMLTLTDELRRANKLVEIGGAFFITKLTENVASAAHIESHAMIVSELSMRRKMIEEASNIVKMAYDSSIDFDTTIERTVNIVDKITVNVVKQSKVLTFIEGAKIFMDKLAEKQRFNESKHGFKTAISTLKRLVPEYKGGQLIYIAGRPSMGKTDFVLNEAYNAIKSGERVLFFSLEMTAEELVGRLIERVSGVTNYDMERPLSPYEYDQIDKSIITLQNIGLFIDDTPEISIAHVRAKVKAYKKLHNITGIVIDYLQLMNADKSLTREQQVATISRSLKTISKEFDIPVITLAQLNRGAESRGSDGYKPRLADMRESGSIEQDADIVMFPYRPEYYYPDDFDLKGSGLIIVAKNRGGFTGEAKVKINLARHTWIGPDDDRYYQSESNGPVTLSPIADFIEPKSVEDIPF